MQEFSAVKKGEQMLHLTFFAGCVMIALKWECAKPPVSEQIMWKRGDLQSIRNCVF